MGLRLEDLKAWKPPTKEIEVEGLGTLAIRSLGAKEAMKVQKEAVALLGPPDKLGNRQFKDQEKFGEFCVRVAKQSLVDDDGEAYPESEGEVIANLPFLVLKQIQDAVFLFNGLRNEEDDEGN